MDMFNFSILSQSDQLDLLYHEGCYIGKIRSHHLFILLYQYNGFYVEIIYEKYRYAAKEIKCFKSTSRIDPYLDAIEVPGLIDAR